MMNWPNYIGEVHVTDESKPGEVTKLFAGDVIHVEYGSRNILSSPNKAKCKNKVIWIFLFDRYWFDTLPQALPFLMLHRTSTLRTTLLRNDSVDTETVPVIWVIPSWVGILDKCKL